MRPLALLLATAALAACGGPARVTYDRDHCFLDGQPVFVEQVEAEQSRLARRVLDRQPIQTAITLAVLLIAGATYIDKLIRLFAGRHAHEADPRRSLAVRVRELLDRQRSYPVRYFAIVGGTAALLVSAAAVYLYLDADKRASERALQQLQFCHLALKTAAEQASLDEQRKNLDALSSTAGNIKQLVDQLPPEEQRKAELLLSQMRTALGNQSQLLARQSAVAQAVQAGSELIQRNLGALAADVGGLKPLPAHIKELEAGLGRLEARTQPPRGTATLGEALQAVQAQVGQLDGKVAQIDCARARLPSGKTVGEALAELASRPPPACRCECASPPTAPPPAHAAEPAVSAPR
jgi:hypothetical protein